MLVFESGGLRVRFDEDLFLVDQSRKTWAGETASFVTHAHSDHANVPRSPKCDFFMSRETKLLLGLSGERIKSVEGVGAGTAFDLGAFSVSFHDAGHVLGSRQIKFANGNELVVSSDFKLEDDLLFKGAEIVSSDILVVESTFGKPDFKFPPREDVYARMASWVNAHLKAGASVILSGYRLGKAQELTRFVNDFIGVVPIVHPQVFEVNEVYESCGVSLGSGGGKNYLCMSDSESLSVARDPAVFIIPPSLVNLGLIGALSLQFKRNFVSAFASGWSGYFRGGSSTTFPLSSHADFDQIIRYVKESEPKVVYTTHGFATALARLIRRHTGVKAEPLVKKKQSDLTEFCSA